MFGILNPTKLLFTVLVVAAIWYGFKWLNSKTSGDGKVSGTRPRNRVSDDGGDAVEEMIRCKACGDFMPENRAVACGRPDCPFP